MKLRMLVLVALIALLAASLASGGEIICRVERVGRPEPGVRVVLDPGGASQTTDAAGKCSFAGVAACTYSVQGTKTIGGVLYGAVAEGVTVPAAGPAVTLTLRLTRAMLLTRYLPCSVGDRRQYKETITQPTGVTTRTRRERSVGTEMIGGETAIVVECTHTPAGDDRKEYMRTASEGHTRYREAKTGETMNYVPPMRFKNLWPLGHEQSVRCIMRYDTGAPDETMVMNGTFTRFEAVTVPAGTFADCARLEFKQQVGGRAQTMTLWMAPGVGIVRSDERSPDKRYLRVLEEYAVRPVIRIDLPKQPVIQPRQ